MPLTTFREHGIVCEFSGEQLPFKTLHETRQARTSDVAAPFERHERAEPRSWPRAEAVRAALCAKFPQEFEHGYRTGYLGEPQKPCDAAGYMTGHHTWPLERKNAWFAGFLISATQSGGPAMDEPPQPLDFRARAHAIAALRKQSAQTVRPEPGSAAPEIITRRASEINARAHFLDLEILARARKVSYHRRRS